MSMIYLAVNIIENNKLGKENEIGCLWSFLFIGRLRRLRP